MEKLCPTCGKPMKEVIRQSSDRDIKQDVVDYCGHCPVSLADLKQAPEGWLK